MECPNFSRKPKESTCDNPKCPVKSPKNKNEPSSKASKKSKAASSDDETEDEGEPKKASRKAKASRGKKKGKKYVNKNKSGDTKRAAKKSKIDKVKKSGSKKKIVKKSASIKSKAKGKIRKKDSGSEAVEKTTQNYCCNPECKSKEKKSSLVTYTAPVIFCCNPECEAKKENKKNQFDGKAEESVSDWRILNQESKKLDGVETPSPGRNTEWNQSLCKKMQDNQEETLLTISDERPKSSANWCSSKYSNQEKKSPKRSDPLCLGKCHKAKTDWSNSAGYETNTYLDSRINSPPCLGDCSKSTVGWNSAASERKIKSAQNSTDSPKKSRTEWDNLNTGKNEEDDGLRAHLGFVEKIGPTISNQCDKCLRRFPKTTFPDPLVEDYKANKNCGAVELIEPGDGLLTYLKRLSTFCKKNDGYGGFRTEELKGFPNYAIACPEEKPPDHKLSFVDDFPYAENVKLYLPEFLNLKDVETEDEEADLKNWIETCSSKKCTPNVCNCGLQVKNLKQRCAEFFCTRAPLRAGSFRCDEFPKEDKMVSKPEPEYSFVRSQLPVWVQKDQVTGMVQNVRKQIQNFDY